MRLQGVWKGEAESEYRAGRLRPGTRVFLCPEPNNEYDPNAIRVELSGSRAYLGHLPRPLARCVRANLEDGHEYRAELSHVSRNSNGDLIVDINCSFNGQANAEFAHDPGSVPGVYVITNWATLKIYVGKAENVGDRLRLHEKLLEENKHDKIEMQKDWNKYGEKFFRFELLDHKMEGKSLEELEAKWLYLYGTHEPHNGYNLGEGWTLPTEPPKPPVVKPPTTPGQGPGEGPSPTAPAQSSGIPRWIWIVALAIFFLWLIT